MQCGNNDFRELLVLILRSFLFAAAAKKATNVTIVRVVRAR